MFEGVWLELHAYSMLELIAVLASFIYILLAANNNRYCWPAAFISSVIFVVVMWNARLLMDSALNFYYAIMAIVGWIVWSRKQAENDSSSNIGRWALSTHVYMISAVVMLSLFSGSLLQHFTSAAFPYLDSLTTWGSLLATWMLAQKVLENWLYWIVLDLIAIYLYINKSLFFTTVLFICFVVMSMYAYYNWRKQSHLGTASVASITTP